MAPHPQRLSVSRRAWPLAQPFAISRGSRTTAEVVVAEVSDGEFRGRGECVPYPRYGESVDSVLQALEAMKGAVFSGLDRHELQRAMPPGTRIVTYAGYADEIPACYDCELALFRDELKLWVKRREYDPDIEHLGLCISCSYRGPIGWAPPRT